MAKSRYQVLVLDAEFVASLTILRSLSRQGVHCDMASSLTHTISQYSRYAKKYFQYPDPLIEADDFVDFICNLLHENDYDLVIPVTERSLIPLSESTKLDPWRERLAIADKNSLSKVLNKAKTMALAQELGVSIPFNYPVSSLEEVKQLSNKLSYPVVLKPGQSIPDADNRRQLSVTYAHDVSELIALSRELLPFCQLLIQQYAEGIGTGVELLANHGEIVYAFQHQRLHELPLTGGGSCLRKSIAVDPVLLDAARQLISSLQWHGVAMVEFKWQPETGKYWLMEINGRFWGSLPLANAAGADFPIMLFDLLVLRKLPNKPDYKKNIYCRKLSADLHWLEQVIRRNEDSRLVRYPSKKQILQDLALFFRFNHYYDIQSISDPLPGLIDIFTVLKEYSLRLYELFRLKAVLRYHASDFVRKRLNIRLSHATNILFLCYGNINRSALAQAVAEQALETESVLFNSTGFHAPDKRPADPNMVRVAEKNNIDLSDWQSSTINGSLVDQADIILGMEVQHLSRLYHEYPAARGKSYLLGSIISNQSSNTEISDPYNKDGATYNKIFVRVQRAVEELNKYLINTGQDKVG